MKAGRPRKSILRVDTKLVRLIEDDPSSSNLKLAKQLGISPGKVAERRKDLERRGFIDPLSPVVRGTATRRRGEANRSKMLEIYERHDGDFDETLRALEKLGLPHSSSYLTRVLADEGVKREQRERDDSRSRRPVTILIPVRGKGGEVILMDWIELIKYQMERESAHRESKPKRAEGNSPESIRREEEKPRRKIAKDAPQRARGKPRIEQIGDDGGAEFRKVRAVKPSRS